MKILIIGSSGSIGSKIYILLSKFFEVSKISKKEFWSNSIENISYDVVINCAFDFKKPWLGPKIIKNLQSKYLKRTKYFIHMSTFSVYSMKNEFISENCILKCGKDPYSRSKILEENLIEKNNSQTTSFIIRLPVVIGKNTMWLEELQKIIFAKSKKLPMFGGGRLHFISTNDIANCCLHICNSIISGKSYPGIVKFNLAYPKSSSWYEFLSVFSSKNNNNPIDINNTNKNKYSENNLKNIFFYIIRNPIGAILMELVIRLRSALKKGQISHSKNSFPANYSPSGSTRILMASQNDFSLNQLNNHIQYQPMDNIEESINSS